MVSKLDFGCFGLAQIAFVFFFGGDLAEMEDQELKHPELHQRFWRPKELSKLLSFQPLVRYAVTVLAEIQSVPNVPLQL